MIGRFFVSALVLLLLPGAGHAILSIPEIHRTHEDFDLRQGAVEPSPEALATVAGLGATARWNRFGTVHAMFRQGGFLATGLTGDPVAAARQWIGDHRELFGLSAASVDGLELVRQSTFAASSVKVLLFGQRVGDLPVMHEGRIKMGIVDGKLFWVASSSIGEPGSPPGAVLTPAQAWFNAATRLGLSVPLSTILEGGQEETWTLLEVEGLSHLQRARLVALGLPGEAAVPAYETIVLHLADGELTGYTTYVNALNGEPLVGQNRVWQLGAPRREASWSGAWSGDPLEAGSPSQSSTVDQRTETYSGEYPPGQASECGPCHGPFAATAEEEWLRLAVTAAAAVASNDIVFDVYQNDSSCIQNHVLHGDLATSPEVAVWQPEGGVPAGDYYVQVCPFNELQLEPTDYTGSVTFERTPELDFNPKWRLFGAYPRLDHASMDTRILGCWFDRQTDGTPVPGCEDAFARASSHRIPWDFEPLSSAPTLTTTGNNDRASEAWGLFLSGGGPYQPVSVERHYDYPWTNEWFESSCDPTRIVHGGLDNDNDIDAAIANLFVQHNRVHDWAYHLGLREREGVAQISNFGQTPPSRQHDPELGNAQAGAATGGAAGGFRGRDNANQLTLNDGIPPLSNMYLWQTVGGAIYAPCVDGDFDASVIAHEYGHLIQNRMVDPDAGLSGRQGRAMGEAWSDLTAIAFLNQFGQVPVGNENPFAVAVYVTGDAVTGIRNYAMNNSPLNYGNVGYDFVCETDTVTGNCIAISQVHADGEIWSATNFDIRRQLVSKYNAQFPASDRNLQRRCASGELPPDRCPGNRRWAQIMHDAFLLMPSAPSMVDARDAYLAADMARAADPALDWSGNQFQLWHSFARRGLGRLATSQGGADFDPTPDFSSALARNAKVTFKLRAADAGAAPLAGEIYVGVYEARSNPVADTHPGTALGNTRRFAPGTYDFVARADGHGHVRFRRTFQPGQETTLIVRMPANWASRHKGASATGAGERHNSLIDDTEATNWERIGAIPSVDVERPQVRVSLPGRRQVKRVQVSGMLQAVLGEPLQNRYSSIQGFRVLACDATVKNCDLAANFSAIFASPPNVFEAANLRPLVPGTKIRSFNVTATQATHLIFEATHNKCTGAAKYQGYLGIPGNDDSDPLNDTSCLTGGNPQIPARNKDVRAAEFQAFSAGGWVQEQ